MSTSRSISLALGVALALVGAPFTGMDAQDTRPATVAEDLRMFSQVLHQLRINHSDSLDTHQLFMAAIEGMVRAADPHSYVLPALRLSPEKRKALEEGKLHPIPIDFADVNGALVVLRVRPGSKASSLDILPGDELVAVDGESVVAQSAEELDIVLSGADGSRVTLTLARTRSSGVARLARSVEREELAATPAVVAALLLDEQTGYIRLSHFGHQYVGDEFHEAFEMLLGHGMERLVLDLRDNGGGLLAEATAVASEFLAQGTVVYRRVEPRLEETKTVRVEDAGLWQSDAHPVIVLVNTGTASAAEILAGALQDHDRALIVGHSTFGKSLIMRRFPLADGSMIMLVVGRATTPCGRTLQRPYRDVRLRDYLMAAGAAADTTGLPSCQTRGGRTVYGGGGVQPDVTSPRSVPPEWYTTLSESGVISRWVVRYRDEHPNAFGAIDELVVMERLPDSVVAHFAAFAENDEVAVRPELLDSFGLHATLIYFMAHSVGGELGAASVQAYRDAEVIRALDLFPRAIAITAKR